MNLLPNELLMEVFTHLKETNEEKSLRNVASCLFVDKRWNNVITTPFKGNPALNERPNDFLSLFIVTIKNDGRIQIQRVLIDYSCKITIRIRNGLYGPVFCS